MAQGTTFGQLHTAVGGIIAAAKTMLTLLDALNPEATIVIARPFPPGKPDWRCFTGMERTAPLWFDPEIPQTADWRCRPGVEVKAKDLTAFLRAISEHCEIVHVALAAEDPSGSVPTT